MAHSLDVDHTAYEDDIIDRSYVVFEIVRKLVYDQWKTGMRDGEWDENH